MSSTPQLPPVASPSAVPVPASESSGRWMHDVRNELNTAMMSAAAARRLLQDGDRDEALENIQRTEAACYRCAQLLRRDADLFG
jgi:hypothetical protein